MDIQKVIEYREWLHKNPELSFKEYNTQAFICGVLSSLGIEHKKIADTGVLAVIGSGDAVVLRADMDALPIEENSGEEFSSQSCSVMHACGHDIHSATLLGALWALSENPPQDRTILGLFQPGEEVAPGGALKVIESGALDNYNIKAIIGLHSSPELSVGEIGIRSGEFMASTDEVHITVKGIGGHAARPQNLKNPVWAAVELLSELHELKPADGSDHILAFGRIEAAGATNVIPDSVKIEGTFRTFSRQWRDECKAMIRELATKVAEKHSLEIEVTTLGGYPPVVNDRELTAEATEILKNELGESKVIGIEKRMTAEDFGRYCEKYPALFFRLGVTPEESTPTELHRANFRADSQSISYGVRAMERLARVLTIKHNSNKN